MVNFGAPDTVPDRFSSRLFYRHNAQTTLMRTNVEENDRLGRVIADKLNLSKGPTVLLLPLRGISALDAEGEPFDDPVARGALFAALRSHVDGTKVDVVEVDAYINDASFADLAADRLWDLMARVETSHKPERRGRP
jgi:uncharacterized protein (UPF0261 family)